MILTYADVMKAKELLGQFTSDKLGLSRTELATLYAFVYPRLFSFDEAEPRIGNRLAAQFVSGEIDWAQYKDKLHLAYIELNRKD